MKADASRRVIQSLDALPAWIGKEAACSDWLKVDQQRILRFAEATGDRQWIHTDPERARRESPFGSAIAHGYLTLSLLPQLLQSCLRIDGVGMAINYGLDRVRFPAPLPVDRRVRARVALERLESIANGVQAHWAATVELEHSDKPVCVAQLLVRYYRSLPTP
jgi:acyl dehydratase